MNLRISAQQLRFRISMAELEQLLQDGAVAEQVPLPGSDGLAVRIVAAAGSAAMGLACAPRQFQLQVPRAQLEELHRKHPDAQGARARQQAAGGQSVELLLQVDVR